MIKSLERQILLKADVATPPINVYNLVQVNNDRKEKFSLERSVSDKQLVSKGSSKGLFRYVNSSLQVFKVVPLVWLTFVYHCNCRITLKL